MLDWEISRSFSRTDVGIPDVFEDTANDVALECQNKADGATPKVRHTARRFRTCQRPEMESQLRTAKMTLQPALNCCSKRVDSRMPDKTISLFRSRRSPFHLC